MGLGQDKSDAYDEQNSLIHESIKQNELEIAQKREALTNERIGIIKNSGKENWNRATITGAK